MGLLVCCVGDSCCAVCVWRGPQQGPIRSCGHHSASSCPWGEKGAVKRSVWPCARCSAGAGLGLAIIARWIAEAHGARTEVESTVGLGSTFTVALPPSNRLLTAY